MATTSSAVRPRGAAPAPRSRCRGRAPGRTGRRGVHWATVVEAGPTPSTWSGGRGAPRRDLADWSETTHQSCAVVAVGAQVAQRDAASPPSSTSPSATAPRPRSATGRARSRSAVATGIPRAKQPRPGRRAGSPSRPGGQLARAGAARGASAASATGPRSRADARRPCSRRRPRSRAEGGDERGVDAGRRRRATSRTERTAVRLTPAERTPVGAGLAGWWTDSVVRVRPGTAPRRPRCEPGRRSARRAPVTWPSASGVAPNSSSSSGSASSKSSSSPPIAMSRDLETATAATMMTSAMAAMP